MSTAFGSRFCGGSGRNLARCDGSPLVAGAGDQLEPGQAFANPGKNMAALIAILIFIAAIFVLNAIEFGRVD